MDPRDDGVEMVELVGVEGCFPLALELVSRLDGLTLAGAERLGVRAAGGRLGVRPSAWWVGARLRGV